MNLAWDADRLNLALLWKNDFIDASKHWVGSRPGLSRSLGRLRGQTGCWFADRQADEPQAEWPKLNKNQSAREFGYRFRGYSLNAAGQPTFKFELNR